MPSIGNHEGKKRAVTATGLLLWTPFFPKFKLGRGNFLGRIFTLNKQEKFEINKWENTFEWQTGNPAVPFVF